MDRVLNYTAVLFLVAGCSGSDDGAPPTDGPQENCQDGLCLAIPESGFQIWSEGAEIQPGEDIEYCEAVRLPGEPGEKIYVRGFEVAMSGYSHHMNMTGIYPGSAKDDEWPVGERKPCSGLEGFVGQQVMGSQRPYLAEYYPDGVGRVFDGGQKVLIDYHYFNVGGDTVKARTAVNFHTTTADKVTRIAGDLMALNLTINIPPMQKRDFTADCIFTKSTMLYSVQRHTHRWGTDFDIWHAGGERDGEHIWTSEHFEDTNYPLPEPTLIEEGEGLRFRCAFNNTTESTLYYGVKATNEMCNLFAVLYPIEDGETEGSQVCWIND